MLKRAKGRGRALQGWGRVLALVGAVACCPAQAAESSAGRAADKPAATRTSGAKVRPAAAKTMSLRAKAGPAKVARRVAEPVSHSMGHSSGLQKAIAPLDLKSSVAFVVDQNTDEVLLNKNSDAVLPIASITKLMTALVVTEAGLSLDEPLVVTQDDVAATAGTRSRLALGTELSRGEMLHLALMASENRAAHVLGRTFPGGLEPFITAMNNKARELGMQDTHYVEPTGLSSNNQSSAKDLSRLVRAAFVYPIIRELSTSPQAVVPVGRRKVEFRNTNGLVHNPTWEIGLQKTGYIAAAGRCVVMQAQMAGRSLIMVLLDSAGKYSRIADAERIRKWLAANPSGDTAVVR